MRTAAALVVSLLLAVSVQADVLILNDGTRLEGEVKRNGSSWVITLADGSSRTVAMETVKSFQVGGARGSGQAAEGLASLRRSVEALTNVDQVIERYQRFIDATQDPKVVEAAKADLETWRDRKARGLVKHGSNWIAPEEIAAIRERGFGKAEEARELIRANRSREAEQLLQTALAEDPGNPAALYLRGVILYRGDKLVDARKAFEAVNQAIANHPPALNNLAVITGRQNQQSAMLNFYDQAMQASGVNKFILDNVAEAIGAIPEDQRKGVAITKCLRRFTELDVVLQQQMAQQGLYRWGGSWVDQKQLDELKVAEAQVREKLSGLQNEFDQAKARIAQIDAEVRRNDQEMDAMRTRSVYTDKDGKLFYMPLPQQYYDYQRQNQQLRAEQDGLQVRLKTMQEEARRAAQQTPVPKYAGVQQIVGVEGMPTLPDQPAEPTTAPTSRGAGA